MKIRSCTAGLALAMTVGVSLPALAGGSVGSFSTVQNQEFKFSLFPAAEDSSPIPQAILAQNWDRIYTGNTNLNFNQFQAVGNQTLDSVQLDIASEITGVIRTFTFGKAAIPQEDVVQAVPYGIEKIGFASAAQIGMLRAEADFGDYVLGVDGNVGNDGSLFVSELGTGSASTSMPDSLLTFIGDGDVSAFVASCLMVNYSDDVGQNAGGEGLVSGGKVTLTYNYTDAGGTDGGGPKAIPTPAALPAGLMLMSMLGLRRKRNADA